MALSVKKIKPGLSDIQLKHMDQLSYEILMLGNQAKATRNTSVYDMLQDEISKRYNLLNEYVLEY